MHTLPPTQPAPPAGLQPAVGSALPTAWLFPGQGSQSVGMARELLAAFAPARTLLGLASELAGADLAVLLARGPEALLTRTDHLQPALTVVNLDCCELLREAGFRPDAVAGHSLGEFSALYAAGVLDAQATLRLVVQRGALMHQAAARLDGGMLAVKGASAAEVQAVLDAHAADIANATLLRAGAPGNATDAAATAPVVIANINGPQQVALAGTRAALERARERLAAAGFGSVALNVSGPWHSPLLQRAAARFAEALGTAPFADATLPVFTNVAASARLDAATLRHDAQAQMCSPVQWYASLQALHRAGVRRFIEVGPGKVLRGLLRGAPETAECEVANVDGPKALRFVEGWS